MITIKPCDTFYAVLRKNERSKTLGGVEAAGRRIGPFVTTNVAALVVTAGDRIFVPENWTLSK